MNKNTNSRAFNSCQQWGSQRVTPSDPILPPALKPGDSHSPGFSFSFFPTPVATPVRQGGVTVSFYSQPAISSFGKQGRDIPKYHNYFVVKTTSKLVLDTNNITYSRTRTRNNNLLIFINICTPDKISARKVEPTYAIAPTTPAISAQGRKPVCQREVCHVIAPGIRSDGCLTERPATVRCQRDCKLLGSFGSKNSTQVSRGDCIHRCQKTVCQHHEGHPQQGSKAA